jgi:DNA-binding transcriptional MocR family regulator
VVDQGAGLTTRLSNPLGGTMPEERQKQLLRLASDFDIQMIEDDIYGELMFEQNAPRP